MNTPYKLRYNDEPTAFPSHILSLDVIVKLPELAEPFTAGTIRQMLAVDDVEYVVVGCPEADFENQDLGYVAQRVANEAAAAIAAHRTGAAGLIVDTATRITTPPGAIW